MKDKAAKDLAKKISDHLFLVGNKVNSKARLTQHKRLNNYVDTIFELSRAFKEIADGEVEDYDDPS